ncbi:MAG: TonB-dependent receptor, partial [Pseudomonadota bacterium]
NEDDVFSGAFMVNAPLIEDELAIRITGEGSLGQSYVDILPTVPAGFDPEDERFGRIRGKLLYEPRQMPGLSLLFSVDHVENEQPTQGLVNDVDNIRIDNTNPFALVSSYEDVTQTVYQAKSTYEINDRLTWVSRVAYLDNELLFRDTEDVLDFGFPFVLGATGFDKSQIEAETYLQFGEYGIMRRGVVGVIHNTEHEDGFNTGTLEFSADGRIANTGIYGEVEISADELVEGLTFVAGGRLEIDDRFRRTQAPLGNPVGDIDLQATEFLPKLGVRYEPTENTAVGYTYSRGFRAGGLDVDLTAPIFQLPLSTSAFGPEFIDQHEIYARGSFLDGRLNLSAAGFYYVWDDAQVEGAAQFLGGAVSLIGNVPEAVGFGAEFAAVFAVSPQLSITGSLGLLDTEITDPGADLAEFDGAALPRAPEVTVSAGIAWTPIEDLIAKFDVRHIGSTVSALGQPEMSSYTVADVSLGHRFAAGSTEFQVQGFVKNLLDERYETFKELSQIGLLSAVGRPRTFGVALTARW